VSGEKLSVSELLASLDQTASEILGVISFIDEKEINTIASEDSWTIGQVADHLVKSNHSIAQALDIHSLKYRNHADLRKKELESQFLNFSVKFKSPGFILPDKSYYNKEKLIKDLSDSFKNLYDKSNHAYLSEMITHRAFGDITKLELIYFVWYHSQRHLRQIKNISQILKTKNNESSKSLFKL
jgi:hypothetical protein